MRALFCLPLLIALASPALGAPPATPAANQAARYYQSLSPEASGVAAAQPLDPEAQKVAKELEKQYGVRVLSAEPGELDGQSVWRVVVMLPGGDFNNADAVDTLIVDAATGKLVPAFHQGTSRYQLSAPPDRTPRNDGVATTIRRDTFRKQD